MKDTPNYFVSGELFDTSKYQELFDVIDDYYDVESEYDGSDDESMFFDSGDESSEYESESDSEIDDIPYVLTT